MALMSMFNEHNLITNVAFSSYVLHNKIKSNTKLQVKVFLYYCLEHSKTAVLMTVDIT